MAQKQPRSTERSPADLLRFVVAAVVLFLIVVVELLIGEAAAGFVEDLFHGLDALPEWLLEGVVVAARVGFVVASVVGLAAVVAHRRWRLLLMVLAAALAGLIMTVGLSQINAASAPTVVEMSERFGIIGRQDFPPLGTVGAVTAALTAAAPWMDRRARRWGWALLIVMTSARLLVDPVLANTPLALSAGWAAGAAVLVAAGAPSRRPDAESIRQGLGAVGAEIETLEPALVDARGSTPYFATTAGGEDLFVKVLGVDERSADLLFRLYRALIPRHLGDQRPFSSLRRAVEHEALVALAAHDLGVRTPRLVAFARADPHGFVLAYEAIAGRSLDGVEPERLSDERLDELWSQLALLRQHGIAHRDLRLANVFLADDDQIWMIDFGFSELAASDLLLATDLAQLLTSLSLSVGPDRAVDSARTALTSEVLETADSRLESYALSGATRSALRDAPTLLDELRSRVDR